MNNKDVFYYFESKNKYLYYNVLIETSKLFKDWPDMSNNREWYDKFFKINNPNIKIHLHFGPIIPPGIGSFDSITGEMFPSLLRFNGGTISSGIRAIDNHNFKKITIKKFQQKHKEYIDFYSKKN